MSVVDQNCFSKCFKLKPLPDILRSKRTLISPQLRCTNEVLIKLSIGSGEAVGTEVGLRVIAELRLDR